MVTVLLPVIRKKTLPLYQIIKQVIPQLSIIMTPQLTALKQDLINNNNYYINGRTDFTLKYKTHMIRGHYRVTLFIVFSDGKSVGYEKVNDYYNYEEAITETYRLNGWGAPKQICKK